MYLFKAFTLLSRVLEVGRPPRNKAAESLPESSSSVPYQIGVHYRCGDISYLHPGSGAADRACQHDSTGSDPHPEAVHMKYGTPIEVGE